MQRRPPNRPCCLLGATLRSDDVSTHKDVVARDAQLFLRIDRDLIEREFCALTHSDETERIEFDPLPQEHMARAGTLAHLAQMLCDDLKNDSSA